MLTYVVKKKRAGYIASILESKLTSDETVQEKKIFVIELMLDIAFRFFFQSS